MHDGALGLARLELRRVVLGLPGLVTLAVLIVVGTSSSGELVTELARGDEAARVARGLRRQSLWSAAISVVSLLCVLHAAGTPQRWREGEGEWLGSRPVGRGTVLASVWLGQAIGAAALLLVTWGVVRFTAPGGEATFALAHSSADIAAGVVEPGASVRVPLSVPASSDDARPGEVEVHLLASWTARAGAAADPHAGHDHAHDGHSHDGHAHEGHSHDAAPAGGHRHLEGPEAQAAVQPEGSSARSGMARAVVTRGAREASNARPVEGRTRLLAPLPSGAESEAELVIENTGDAPWILIGQNGVHVWTPVASAAGVDGKLWWRASWTLAPLLALALLLAPWMSVGSALGTVAALVLLASMSGVTWLPGRELFEALRIAGLGRVPATGAVLAPTVAALLTSLSLFGATRSLRSWRHSR